MKFHTLTGLFLIPIVFSLSYPSALAAKTAKYSLVGANLRLYTPPSKQDCDINVPTQYATIQEGINAASIGDTVCVGPGIYKEDVIINKSIRLSGRGANKQTIIYGQNQVCHCQGAVWIVANDATLEGFLIIGTGPDYTNAAVHLSELVTNAAVRYNRLVAGKGGLAFLTDNAQHHNLVQHNILEGNDSPFVANVSQFDNNKPSDKVDFLNNTFVGTVNPIDRQDTGITLNAGAPNSLIKQNSFHTTGVMTALVSSNNSSRVNENNFNGSTTIEVFGEWGTPLNAENNWWGDTDPSDNIQRDVDFTPFALVPFPEN